MAWKNWGRESLLPVKVVREKKFKPSYQDEFLDKIINILRTGKSVHTSRRYLARFQWKIHNPDFEPKLRVHITITEQTIIISPLNSEGMIEANGVENMFQEKRFKTKFHKL